MERGQDGNAADCINTYMSKYNWTEIQTYYDDGHTTREVCKKYGMSSKTVTLAVRNGLLVTRSLSEAVKMDHAKNPRSYTDEFKEKQRRHIMRRYEEGWMPKAGRCRKYWYESNVAGLVSLDGTWELITAFWLDYKQFNWKRNTKRFKYIHLNGKESYYTPDFYVGGLGYVEVKGYKTKLDDCKWTQFNEPLTIWLEKDIKRFKGELAEWSKALSC